MAGYETIISGTSPSITAVTQLDGTPIFSATTSGITFGVPVSGAGGYATGVRQVVSSTTTGVQSTTTTLPTTSSVPTSTQGAQFASATITPQSATSSIYVLAAIQASSSNINTVTAALFRDATANAFAAASMACLQANSSLFIFLWGLVSSGSVTSTTFKLRSGPAGAGTLTVNGFGTTSQLLGSSSNTGIVLIEVGA